MNDARGAASWDAEREPVADDLLTMHWFDGGIASESPRTHRSDCPACEILRLREQLDAAREALEQIVSMRPIDRRQHGADVARAALGVEGEPGADQWSDSARELRALVVDLIAYSHLSEKVRLREDPSEYKEAERLIARADALLRSPGVEGEQEPGSS